MADYPAPDVWMHGAPGMFPAQPDAHDTDLCRLYVRYGDYQALAAEVARLRAEIDECQSERLEQARLLGISAERELRLIAERDEAFRAGYLAGFSASAEGWNAEYPFEGENPEDCQTWVERRDADISAIRALLIPDKEGEA